MLEFDIPILINNIIIITVVELICPQLLISAIRFKVKANTASIDSFTKVKIGKNTIDKIVKESVKTTIQ